MAAPPPPNTTLATKVSLTFSCKGLLDKDLTSKSDPIIQVMTYNHQKNWREVGRTEHIMNTHNPEFTKAIEIDYFFEEVQKLKIMVYDVDNATQNLGDDDFLGRHECTLGQIVASRIYTKELTYRSGSSAGTVTVVAEEMGQSNNEVSLKFQGQNLDKKDFLSKSDPYLEFAKDRGDGNFITVHRTNHIDNTLNPSWPEFKLDTKTLCSGNYDLQIRIAVYDYDENDDCDLIGHFHTTFTELSSCDGQKQWDLINPKKQKKKKSYKNSGIIILDSIKVERMSTFLEYVMSGCQINFTVGVDFTASNGNPTDPSSLHYFNPSGPNDYVQALTAVGEVCQDYDTDKQFPALGFGAKIPPNWQVSFEFPLNFNAQNPYCQGIHNIVAAYQSCVRTIQLYGPTNVAPIINHVTRFTQSVLAQHPPNTASNYFILLLLTDGVISDMADTVRAIVNASYLPISLIIVGVGNADFAQMDFLDCDEGKLRSNDGRDAMRDIVQFVPFRNFKNAPPGQLAKEVLAEVPKQVTEFFKLSGIPPLQPQQQQPLNFQPTI
ncbi:copine-3-like isoform X1 [Clytia hemisphaerica]